MTRLADIASAIRSKNAGPFWITIDIFCDTPDAFARVRDGLSTADVADALQQPRERISRYDMPALDVVKFSLPRPQVQGARTDRDMHGAQMALVLTALPVSGPEGWGKAKAS